ncbi:hypothetical protein OIO90_006244 [Microbotryomycetes sp. JL221]|nr:hypothetical protein OIO90_006244 [Microbotryomycetes sp. JL221]
MTHYDADATIVLIGMRGVGKTTLGLIAATSLRRAFVDADSAFQTLHGCTITAFVKDYVIACGGGVVEKPENREMLKQFRDRGHPIVHVVRDKKETLRYLVDETVRPSWGEEIRMVWTRREPWFESLCTHTIASLMAYPPPASPQFRMKHVETAFVRLLRSIFGFASSHVPVLPGPRPPPVTGLSSGEYGGYGASESEFGRGAKGPRTNFVALNFPDLTVVDPDTIRRVAAGVDCIELRVDTLLQRSSNISPESRSGTPSVGDDLARRIPSLHFVALCFGHLRRCSPLPILYTVRTTTQGGEFPDPHKAHPELMTQYLALLELGFKLGSEYVDVELALTDDTIKRLLMLRGSATQCLGADHDRQGLWKWNSNDVLDKYLRAARLGFDIIKLVSFPSAFEENIELLKFRTKVAELSKTGQVDRVIPLLAINLGKSGQMSRFLNPVFTPVTHPLLPGVAAPGQLTYKQTQQALFLSGLVLEKAFHVPSIAIQELFTKEAKTLGLAYTFNVRTEFDRDDLEQDFGGAFLGKVALPVHSLPTDQTAHATSAQASASGWADLIVPKCTEPTSYDVPPQPIRDFFKYTNVRVLALAEIITQNLSPINAVGLSTSALLVGLGDKDRSEVVEALSLVGARWALCFGCYSSGIHDDRQSHGQTRSRPTTPTSHRSTVLAMASASGAASSAPTSRPTTPLQHLPYPQQAPLSIVEISSLHPSASSFHLRKPPTIIVSASASDLTMPDFWFSSPTGGCALDLAAWQPNDASMTSHGNGIDGDSSNRAAPQHGVLSRAVEEPQGPGSKRRGGWQLLGVTELHAEVARQAFKALTGRRMS